MAENQILGSTLKKKGGNLEGACNGLAILSYQKGKPFVIVPKFLVFFSYVKKNPVVIKRKLCCKKDKKLLEYSCQSIRALETERWPDNAGVIQAGSQVVKNRKLKITQEK